jgi:4a-hydroxytetrahydrobiopterin dehydratase
MPTLSEAEIDAALPHLPGWRFEDAALRKTFTFKGFRAAIAFIDRLAEVAIAARHHPDIANHYDVVEVSVTTHSEGGVTEADVALADGIDAVADPPAGRSPSPASG